MIQDLLETPTALLTARDVLTRLTIAALLGGVLGLEREFKAKPAGLRTHMMVALGAATFSLAIFSVAQLSIAGGFGSSSSLDPTRIVEGVIGGIGFLGAGAIMRNGDTVEGLTTAGSIWVVGAIGVATGAGDFYLAGLATLHAAIILALLGWAERVLAKRARARDAASEAP